MSSLRPVLVKAKSADQAGASPPSRQRPGKANHTSVIIGLMYAGIPSDIANDAATLVREGRHSTSTLRDGTGVLVNLQGMTVLTLNEAGMVLLRELQEAERPSLEALVRLLCSRFDVDEQTALRDATSFLAGLISELSAKRRQ